MSHVRVFENPALGVYEFSQTAINYYPSPIQNSVRIATSETIQNVALYNLLGQELFSKKRNSNTLDLSNLSTGNYLAKIQTREAIQTIKLIGL